MVIHHDASAPFVCEFWSSTGGRDCRSGCGSSDAAVGDAGLIVEDETALAGLLVSYFERDGFDASSTGGGLRAVELAREVDPDVVVLDLGLPGLDGVEVCRQLRTLGLLQE